MATIRRELMDGPRSSFQVGSTLGKTFSIWIPNLIPFAIISIIVFSPLYLWTFMVIQSDRPDVNAITFWSRGMPLVSYLLQQVAAGAMTYGVIQQLNGTKADLGSCIGKGFARLLPVVLVAITAGLGILAGLICLIVPGVILAIMWSVAVPVAIIENPGIMASLSRSSKLTDGSRGPIFLVLLVLGLIGWGINFVLGHTIGAGAGSNWSSARTFMWVTLAIQTLVQASLGAVASAVIYNELRVSREGANIAEIAKVFD